MICQLCSIILICVIKMLKLSNYKFLDKQISRGLHDTYLRILHGTITITAAANIPRGESILSPIKFQRCHSDIHSLRFKRFTWQHSHFQISLMYFSSYNQFKRRKAIITQENKKNNKWKYFFCVPFFFCWFFWGHKLVKHWVCFGIATNRSNLREKELQQSVS